jgi:hypothetical protein
MNKRHPHDYIIPRMPEHISMYIPSQARYLSNISEGRLLVFRLCYTNGKHTVNTDLILLKSFSPIDAPHYELYPNAEGESSWYPLDEYDDMINQIISLLPKVES